MTSGNSKIVRVVPLAVRPFLLTDASNLSRIRFRGISEPLANTIYPSQSNCFPASFSTCGSEKKLPGTFSTGTFISEVGSVFVVWTGSNGSLDVTQECQNFVDNGDYLIIIQDAQPSGRERAYKFIRWKVALIVVQLPREDESNLIKELNAHFAVAEPGKNGSARTELLLK